MCATRACCDWYKDVVAQSEPVNCPQVQEISPWFNLLQKGTPRNRWTELISVELESFSDAYPSCGCLCRCSPVPVASEFIFHVNEWPLFAGSRLHNSRACYEGLLCLFIAHMTSFETQFKCQPLSTNCLKVTLRLLRFLLPAYSKTKFLGLTYARPL